jgi:hypothetical protein
MFNETILFICENLQENWVICGWNSILALYTLYGCQIEIICFLPFFNVAFMFENIFIQSSNIHVFWKHIYNYRIGDSKK